MSELIADLFVLSIDSTGPAIKALYTLTDVQDWSSAGLRLHLQVPDYVEQEIRQQTSDATQQKKALLKRWLKEHPAPSWAVVTEALYQMEEHDVLNRVKMFIAGMLGWWDAYRMRRCNSIACPHLQQQLLHDRYT